APGVRVVAALAARARGVQAGEERGPPVAVQAAVILRPLVEQPQRDGQAQDRLVLEARADDDAVPDTDPGGRGLEDALGAGDADAVPLGPAGGDGVVVVAGVPGRGGGGGLPHEPADGVAE